MGVPVTPWGKAIAEQLADGAWHDLEDLLELGMPLVPPGRAFRHGESDRARRRRDGVAGPRLTGDRTTSIANGARLIVRKAIRDLVRSGSAERDGDRIRYRSAA
jgi:hypothetical protein